MLCFSARVFISFFFPFLIGFQPPSKPSLSCEIVGCDGVGEGSPCQVNEAVASIREVKRKDCFVLFLCFCSFFSLVYIQADQTVMVAYPLAVDWNEVVTDGVTWPAMEGESIHEVNWP